MKPRTVLVTGGAGFVGSHTCKVLARAGIVPVSYDDLRRGNREAVKWGPLVEAPLSDRARLEATLRTYEIDAVLHFAAYAYVGESMEDPAGYLRNNVAESLTLLEAMADCGVDKLVISSTCAVYGIAERLPVVETSPTVPINPYGMSKVMLENAARSYGLTGRLRTVALRYFNAAGADPDGEIGEWHEPEVHLVPNAIYAALGWREEIVIHGDDYPTPDGTAIRDYVHVGDLARAHVAALDHLMRGGDSLVANLGTGHGYSVRQIVQAVERATGAALPVRIGPRRPGDPPELFAEAEIARRVLGWRAERSDLDTMVADALAWYSGCRQKGRLPGTARRRDDVPACAATGGRVALSRQPEPVAFV